MQDTDMRVIMETEKVVVVRERKCKIESINIAAYSRRMSFFTASVRAERYTSLAQYYKGTAITHCTRVSSCDFINQQLLSFIHNNLEL